MPFDIDFTRKIGPLPMWSWFMIAGGAGLIIFKIMGGKKAGGTSPTGAKTGAGTEFSSTNTKTGTDEQGNQFSQSYSAQGNGYLPGMLTYGASPMPYSSGDIYVNLPDSNHTNPDQSGPPAGSREVTLSRDSWIQDIVHDYLPVAGWGKPNPAYPSQPDAVWNPNAPYDIWSGAVESYALMQANPQLDWSHQLSKGTKLYIPPAVGAQKTVQSVTK